MRLPYTFNTLNEKSSDLQKDVADIVHKRFVNFIKTGDPNTDGKQKTLLRWPKYESKHKYVFKFDISPLLALFNECLFKNSKYSSSSLNLMAPIFVTASTKVAISSPNNSFFINS